MLLLVVFHWINRHGHVHMMESIDAMCLPSCNSIYDYIYALSVEMTLRWSV